MEMKLCDLLAFFLVLVSFIPMEAVSKARAARHCEARTATKKHCVIANSVILQWLNHQVAQSATERTLCKGGC